MSQLELYRPRGCEASLCHRRAAAVLLWAPECASDICACHLAWARSEIQRGRARGLLLPLVA